MLKIIRVSGDYGKIVVETIGEPKEYYHNTDSIKIDDFHKITEKVVVGYFSGMADGLGWGELPEQEFTTLEDIKKWARDKQEQYCKERNAGSPKVSDKELLAQLRETLLKMEKQRRKDVGLPTLSDEELIAEYHNRK